MTFADIHAKLDWDGLCSAICASTCADVDAALRQSATGARCTLAQLRALLSPAAGARLEEMARLAHAHTLRRFGRTVQLFAPLYISNECHNVCTYCGFSLTNKIPRKTLSTSELLREAELLRGFGFGHVLVVSGEAPAHAGPAQLETVLRNLRPRFAGLSLEVQPLDTADYARLRQCGLSSVLVYQETYHREAYTRHHLRGRKTDFVYRLETPDRIARAGIRKLGLGALYGLEDWRADTYHTALHLDYLERAYWQTRYSVSFPRLRPHAGDATAGSIPHPVGERELAQAICALRLFNHEAELSLSTRERPHFRDNAMRLGITTMSAGAKTNPGGYAEASAAAPGAKTLEQFSMSDERLPDEIVAMLHRNNYEPVWKDWDACYDNATVGCDAP
ncbi:MAG: 2-iminoacetate synthase ThiH [Puniceicoccales bacterium]|nr:2-iminoacetate synthase ThiH [Puniceicoccales bacterium]